MLIVLPISMGIYVPICFISLGLLNTQRTIGMSMSLLVVFCNIGQFFIPFVMGAISNKQTAMSYEYSYLFLGGYTSIGFWLAIQ